MSEPKLGKNKLPETQTIRTNNIPTTEACDELFKSIKMSNRYQRTNRAS